MSSAALIESGIFLVSGLPGLRQPPFAGLQFRSQPGDHPLANIVGAARLRSAEAGETVVRVREYFAARARDRNSAVTQALSGSSAPICRRCEFIDLFELQVFEWHPVRSGDGDGE